MIAVSRSLTPSDVSIVTVEAAFFTRIQGKSDTPKSVAIVAAGGE